MSHGASSHVVAAAAAMATTSATQPPPIFGKDKITAISAGENHN
jgi:hypothetical protein